MKRDFLEGLGLNSDQVDKVMTQFGKDIAESSANSKELSEKNEQLSANVTGLNKQISDYESQIKELKKSSANNKELQERLDTIQQEAKQQKANFTKQMAAQKKDFAIKSALSKTNAQNADVVAKLLDMDKISLDDNGQLLGFNDQVEALKKDNSFLFKADKPEGETVTGIVAGGNPKPTSKSETIDLSKASYSEVLKFKHDNPEQYKELIEKGDK